MKIKHSLFTRRRFLNSMIGGWITAMGAAFLAPIAKFVFLPNKEPDEILLPKSDYENMEPNTVKLFSWGAKPGLLKMNDDRSYKAFVAVCTHLDCNVSYLPDQRKFFCACHDGWYDENGINIAGPPPTPLRQLNVALDGEHFIITKNKGNE